MVIEMWLHQLLGRFVCPREYIYLYSRTSSNEITTTIHQKIFY